MVIRPWAEQLFQPRYCPRQAGSSKFRPATLTANETVWSAEPRPWFRYFARTIDAVIAVLVVALALEMLAPAFAAYRRADLFAGMAGLLLRIGIEPIFLTQFSATPGKALLGTRVRTVDGRALDFGRAVERSGRVWFGGLGMGIPFVM